LFVNQTNLPIQFVNFLLTKMLFHCLSNQYQQIVFQSYVTVRRNFSGTDRDRIFALKDFPVIFLSGSAGWGRHPGRVKHITVMNLECHGSVGKSRFNFSRWGKPGANDPLLDRGPTPFIRGNRQQFIRGAQMNEMIS
jgi:hypothetical protein